MPELDDVMKNAWDMIEEAQAPIRERVQREDELFSRWRNKYCPRRHTLCFGSSPLYGRNYTWVNPAVNADYGCVTPDELVQALLDRPHAVECDCWQHAVLQSYSRRIRLTSSLS